MFLSDTSLIRRNFRFLQIRYELIKNNRIIPIFHDDHSILRGKYYNLSRFFKQKFNSSRFLMLNRLAEAKSGKESAKKRLVPVILNHFRPMYFSQDAKTSLRVISKYGFWLQGKYPVVLCLNTFWLNNPWLSFISAQAYVKRTSN